MTGRPFVGRTQVEIGEHPAGLVTAGDHRRRQRIAHADHRVTPTDAPSVAGDPDAEGARDLALPQPGDCGVDLALHLRHGVGVGFGTNRGIHQIPDRFGQWLIDPAQPGHILG